MTILCIEIRIIYFPLFNIIYFFFFNDTATTEIYTLSLHDALPIYLLHAGVARGQLQNQPHREHTVENGEYAGRDRDPQPQGGIHREISPQKRPRTIAWRRQRSAPAAASPAPQQAAADLELAAPLSAHRYALDARVVGQPVLVGRIGFAGDQRLEGTAAGLGDAPAVPPGGPRRERL